MSKCLSLLWTEWKGYAILFYKRFPPLLNGVEENMCAVQMHYLFGR